MAFVVQYVTHHRTGHAVELICMYTHLNCSTHSHPLVNLTFCASSSLIVKATNYNIGMYMVFEAVAFPALLKPSSDCTISSEILNAHARFFIHSMAALRTFELTLSRCMRTAKHR